MSSLQTTIYTGFWTNLSYGSVRGSTLTLSATHSAFLVAFIALCVKFAGGQLWTVLILLASIGRATEQPQDGLYHQQQAILRNTSQPTNLLWDMLKISWFWKGNAKDARTRSIRFIFSAIFYIAAFAAAGIFSSKIASNDSEVLLIPGTCGTWPYFYYDDYDISGQTWQDYYIYTEQHASNIIELAKLTHNYVAECYNTTHHNPNTHCLPYGKGRISWTTKINTGCPFDEAMCIADDVQFDSGFINSQTHFGINTKDQVEYRRVLTCAPIKTDGYVTDWVNNTELNQTADADQNVYDGDTYLKYQYGQSYAFNDNTTYAYANFTWGSAFAPQSDLDTYKVDAEMSCVVPDDEHIMTISDFTAIPSLSRDDADTTLVFLALYAWYLSPVQDPWFSATNLSEELNSSPDGTDRTTDFYVNDAPVNVVGCAEQHQFRNPATGAITRLGGQEVFNNLTAQLGFNDNQEAIFNRSFFRGPRTDLKETVTALEAGNLLAAAVKYGGVLPGLPDNQWQLEFSHYFGVGLHALQLWTQQYVTGILRPELDRYVVPATDDFGKEMCHNQITRRDNYRSFSVLGLSIIMVFTLLFTVLNLTISPIVNYIRGHTPEGRYGNAEWRSTDFLQLQRMAYEHKNIGHWTGHNDLVPRTNPGEVFTSPDDTERRENVADIRPRRESGMHRLWSRVSSFKPDNSNSHVENASGLGVRETSAPQTTDLEKNVKVSEVPMKA